MSDHNNTICGLFCCDDLRVIAILATGLVGPSLHFIWPADRASFVANGRIVGEEASHARTVIRIGSREIACDWSWQVDHRWNNSGSTKRTGPILSRWQEPTKK